MYAENHGEWQPELDIDPPERQRRLTVLLRWLILIPHMIILFLLGVVAFFVAITAWFAALVFGELPWWAIAYLGGYLDYWTRVWASQYLLIDSYPPFGFGAAGFPVQIELRPGELNRLAVAFRIFLAIPAIVVAALLDAGWHGLAFFCWLVVLILGRNPEPLFEATAAILRFTMRTLAYLMMLTSAYPKRLFGEERAVGEHVSKTHPLRLHTPAKVLVVLFLIVGAFGTATGGDRGDYFNYHSRTTLYSRH